MKRGKNEKTKPKPRALPALRRTIGRRAGRRGPARWNPNPDDVQRSVVQLVLSLVEFLRRLLERQTLRRMEDRTLDARQIEKLGVALMQLEKTVHRIAGRFGLDPSDLDLDLGPLGKLSGTEPRRRR